MHHYYYYYIYKIFEVILLASTLWYLFSAIKKQIRYKAAKERLITIPAKVTSVEDISRHSSEGEFDTKLFRVKYAFTYQNQEHTGEVDIDPETYDEENNSNSMSHGSFVADTIDVVIDPQNPSFTAAKYDLKDDSKIIPLAAIFAVVLIIVIFFI